MRQLLFTIVFCLVIQTNANSQEVPAASTVEQHAGETMRENNAEHMLAQRNAELSREQLNRFVLQNPFDAHIVAGGGGIGIDAGTSGAPVSSSGSIVATMQYQGLATAPTGRHGVFVNGAEIGASIGPNAQYNLSSGSLAVLNRITVGGQAQLFAGYGFMRNVVSPYIGGTFNIFSGRVAGQVLQPPASISATAGNLTFQSRSIQTAAFLLDAGFIVSTRRGRILVTPEFGIIARNGLLQDPAAVVTGSHGLGASVIVGGRAMIALSSEFIATLQAQGTFGIEAGHDLSTVSGRARFCWVLARRVALYIESGIQSSASGNAAAIEGHFEGGVAVPIMQGDRDPVEIN